MKKLKRIILVVIVLLSISYIYVEVININSVDMTFRQKLLKAFYPVLMRLSKKNKPMDISQSSIKPPVSFYTLSTAMNDGSVLQFEKLKGKKVLLVNTASECGYTAQYAELQQLYEQYKNKLVVVGFPANDFKEQEKGDDKAIAEFCKLNYGVDFPLAAKSSVIKTNQQNPVYKWLTDKAINGWNDKTPSWNFSKYLVDENGVLVNYFDPGVSPMSNEIKEAIN